MDMHNYWIDTHAHLYSKEFDADRADTLVRCEQNNVQKMYMPNVDHSTIDGMMEIESRDEGRCHAMMGLHPCSVKSDFEKELYIVEDWLSKRKFCAIGEIGTDLYWDKTFWEQQKEAFRIQVSLAKRYELPVVIHCRESIDQTIELVEELQHGKLKGIFHCFTGNLEQAQRIIKSGFLLGIGGVATFKKGGLDQVLPEISLEHLVLETDSPYLAPTPFRGKRNEPANIPLIGKKVAEIKNAAIDDIKSTTTRNALQLFEGKV
jgi:TatD DNase family protein